MLVLTAMYLAAPAVSAEKYDWTDKTYDFTAVKRALVDELDTSQSTTNSAIVEKVLKDDFSSKAGRLEVTLVSPALLPEKTIAPAAPKVAPLAPDEVKIEPSPTAVPKNMTAELTAAESKKYQDQMAKITDIYVYAELLRYQHDQVFVPAHTEWRTDYRDYTWHDRHGHSHTDTESYDYPVYIPDHYVPAASVGMRFNVYDAKTGNAVFSREEWRTKGSSSDIRGVYNRIIDAFYKTMKAKIHP